MLGLSHGFGIEPFAIQYGNGPAPLDYRDFITNPTFRGETERHVEKYCGDTLVWNQKGASRDRRTELGLLGLIDLGSPTAENEIQKLGYYFVRTAEFLRALRQKGQLSLEKLLSEDVFGLGAKEIIDLLLWYGFLGVVGPSTEPIFIYDRAYDFRRLEAERADTKDKALYAVNPDML
jgi:hypothetical protein